MWWDCHTSKWKDFMICFELFSKRQLNERCTMETPKTALASKTCCRVATCVLSIRNIAFKLNLVRQVLKKIKNKPWGYLKHQLINAYTYSFQSSNPPSRDDVLQSIWNKNTQTKKIALISKDQSHTPFEWDSPQNNSGTCTKAQISSVTR